MRPARVDRVGCQRLEFSTRRSFHIFGSGRTTFRLRAVLGATRGFDCSSIPVRRRKAVRHSGRQLPAVQEMRRARPALAGQSAGRSRIRLRSIDGALPNQPRMASNCPHRAAARNERMRPGSQTSLRGASKYRCAAHFANCFAISPAARRPLCSAASTVPDSPGLAASPAKYNVSRSGLASSAGAPHPPTVM